MKLVWRALSSIEVEDENPRSSCRFRWCDKSTLASWSVDHSDLPLELHWERNLVQATLTYLENRVVFEGVDWAGRIIVLGQRLISWKLSIIIKGFHSSGRNLVWGGKKGAHLSIYIFCCWLLFSGLRVTIWAEFIQSCVGLWHLSAGIWQRLHTSDIIQQLQSIAPSFTQLWGTANPWGRSYPTGAWLFSKLGEFYCWNVWTADIFGLCGDSLEGETSFGSKYSSICKVQTYNHCCN